jgi:hypothetical protein
VSDSPTLLYLEADDEITAVVRRVRAADAGRVVVVAPGRSRATSSAVALRLLARAGEEDGRELAIVGDALTRSLAAEAGLAAFATVDEARRAEPGAPLPATEPRHAAIHVVRGSATDATVETPVAAADDELTRPVSVTRPQVRSPRPRRRRRTAAAAILALVAVLLVGFVAGAAVLPAATITLVPRGEAVGPVPYVIEVPEPERLSGTAEASATVTATGRYEILEPASGTVVLFNWTFFPQPIAAGTLVAAGEQAFATQADVVVPRGRLTPDGRIEAGQEAVAVVASAPGLAANVDPHAINVVLNQNADARLRGFPENPEQRVDNPEATSGGRDESGPRITRANLDAGLDALREDLREQVGDVLAGRSDAIVVHPDLAEPTVEGADDLVGAHEEEATLEATLSWEAFAADPAEVTEAARQRFATDPDPVPEGHVLLPDSIRIAVEEASMEDGVLRVDVTATGRSAAEVDRAEILDRVMGRTAAEAQAALADLGEANIDLWPGWVGTVPANDWRIDLRVAEP